MKRFIRWLAKVFNANIEVVKEVEVIKEIPCHLPENGTVDGDVTINGNLVVNGYLHVNGGLACKCAGETDNGMSNLKER